MFHAPILHTLAAIPSIAPSIEPAHDWPHWRGPGRTNVSAETEWSSVGAPEPLWRASIGTGYSVPMVADGRVFTVGYLASEEDPNVGEDEVACYDAMTGERRWAVRYPSRAFANEHRGGVIASPTVAGDVLLVASRQGELRALDLETGEARWTVDVVERHEVEPGRYGFASSPFVDGQWVIVCMQRAIAFHIASGDTFWVSEDLGASFSTVARMELPSAEEGGGALPAYCAFGKNGVYALDASTGETLRRATFNKSPRNVEGATPIVLGSEVFISSGYDHGGVMFDMAADPPAELWRSRRMRTKMAGATYVGGHFYGYDESMLACIDGEGALKWRERGLGQGALMVAGDRMLLTTSEGELVVAEASPLGYTELSRREVIDGGVFWAAPVLANGLVYVRGSLGDLVCLDHRGGGAAGGPGAAPVTAEAAAIDPAALEAAYLESTGIRAARERGVAMKGTLHVVALGLEDVAAVWEVDGQGRHHSSFDLPPGYPPGTIHTVFDGTHGWNVDPMRGDRLLPDDRVDQLRSTSGGTTLFDPLPDGKPATYAGRASFRGVDCHRVDVRLDGDRTRSAFFDAQTGRYAGRTAEDESTLVLADWREVDGAWVPFKRTEFDPEQGLENRWSFAEGALAAPEADWFAMSDAIAEELARREAGGEASDGAALEGPDADFLEAAASVGMVGGNWDSPEFIAVAMPHAYRFSHSYTLHSGDYVHELASGDPLDLGEVMVEDFDGPISATEFLANRMQNHNAVILQGGRVVHEHYGNGLDESSTHMCMSVSKSFTSMAAAIMVGQGKLDMERKVVDFLPELAGTAFETATVQEVADMRTAVVLAAGTKEKYWDTRLSDAQGYYGQEASEPYPKGTRDFFQLITERQAFEMGEKYDYQDVNSQILGAVVDAVAGVPFPKVLEAELLQRVGVAADAHFMSDRLGLGMGSTGMNMATKDLARVGLLFLNDGKNARGEQVLPQAYVDALWQGNDEVRSAWALGKESALADGYYKDQFRVLEVGEYRFLAMIGVNGQMCVMHRETDVVIALHGAYPMAETPRFASM
ncbi:MAG: PQQ-binding-like beta-propeller repeat protein [Planctomycetota bacterium]